MNPSPVYNEDIKWFLKNIKQFLIDIRLSNMGYNLSLFLDTIDIQFLTLGVDVLYENNYNKIDFDKFNNKVTLVRCLAFCGWLGQLRMLPPHQAEYLTHLNLNFGLNKTDTSSKHVEEFLTELGVYEDMKLHDISLDTMNEKSLSSFVKKQAGSAESFFKALQIIRFTNWKARLAHLKESQILILDYQTSHYNKLLESNVFNKLKETFDKKRPKSTMNNFSDAIALTILSEKISDCKCNRSKNLPIYFMSSTTFHDVIEETGFAELFHYRFANGEYFSCLRDSDFFIFKCSFHPTIHPESKRISKDVSIWSESELIKLENDLNHISEMQNTMKIDMINKSIFSGLPVSIVIDNLRKYTFLENVWLTSSAEEDVKNIFNELPLILTDERFIRKVNNIIEQTKNALSTNVYEYQWFNDIYINLQKSIDKLKIRIGKENINDIDIFREFGLLRFSYEKDSHDEITSIIGSLISNNSNLENNSINKIVTYMLDYNKYTKIEQFKIKSIITAVLWILGLDNVLISFIEKSGRSIHYSILSTYAASLFRKKKYIYKGQKILNKLINDYNSEKNKISRSNLSVCISYLYFHLWQCKGYKSTWRYKVSSSNIIGQNLIDEAIKYTDFSLKSIPQSDPKYIYALNQKLYYIIEGKIDIPFEEVKAIAKELASYKKDLEKWQYRYDDTLARYFHRTALEVSDLNQKMDLMKTAKIHLQEALNKCHGDPEIHAYFTELSTLII